MLKKVGLCGDHDICLRILEVAEMQETNDFQFIDLQKDYDDDVKRASYLSKALRFAGLIIRSLKMNVIIVAFVSKRSMIIGRLAHLFRIKTIYYWVGTDVWNLLHDQFSKSDLRHIQKVNLNLADGINLSEELSSLNIANELFILSPNLSFDYAKTPPKHAVLLSIPDKSRNFYGYQESVRLIQDFPDISFYVTRSECPDYYPYPNVVFKGLLDKEQMDKVFDEVSIVLRYPQHDGASVFLMEALIKGKEVIYRFEFPHTHRASNYEEIHDALEKLISQPVIPNRSNHQYGVDHFNQKNCGKALIAYLRRVL